MSYESLFSLHLTWVVPTKTSLLLIDFTGLLSIAQSNGTSLASHCILTEVPVRPTVAFVRGESGVDGGVPCDKLVDRHLPIHA